MNRTYILVLCLSILVWTSCDNTKNQKKETDDRIANTDSSGNNVAAPTGEIRWEEIPELSDIGDFPFMTAPEGIDIYDFSASGEKDGISELFPFKKWEVYNGSGITTVEGKLACIRFMEDRSNSLKYDQYIFDRNIPDYLDKIGAKKLYDGPFPENEVLREKLKENMYNGEYATVGLTDDSPLMVYAFRNKGKKYIVNLQSNSAEGNVFVVELKDFEPSVKAYKSKDIANELAEKGKAILYINFDTDKSTLKADGKAVVDEIGKVLKADPNLRISIEGHTDNTGNADYNMKLSTDRAETVRQGLISLGVESSRLQVKGFGAEKPLDKNDNIEGKAKNRRVELVKL